MNQFHHEPQSTPANRQVTEIELQMRTTIEDGTVRIDFSQPIGGFRLVPEQAEEIANSILALVERIRRGIH